MSATIKFAQLDVKIHGLDTSPMLLAALRQVVEDGVRAALRAHPQFGWRNEFGHDLEVEVDLTASRIGASGNPGP